MKRIFAALFLSSLGSLAFAEGSSYALEVDVAPDGSGRANAYLCHVVVTDLEKGEAVMAPQVALLADGAATVSTKAEDGREFVLDLFVESKTSKATADLKVKRGGKVLAEQKTSMALHR
jgi:hypothetical protein